VVAGFADAQSILGRVIAAIQRRWGSQALQPAHQLVRSRMHLSTGIPQLDALLAGGLPHGALTELLGAPTAGSTTLAYTMLAQTQRDGGMVALLDLPATFDAVYAAACGIDLASLLLAQPDTPHAALDLLLQLAAEPRIDLILVDGLAELQTHPGGIALLTTALRRLHTVLAKQHGVVLVLTGLPYQSAQLSSIGVHGSLVGEAAAMRLHLARERWDDAAEPPACISCLTVLRMRGAVAPAPISLPIVFPPQGHWS
jgi:hypothetical protein